MRKIHPFILISLISLLPVLSLFLTPAMPHTDDGIMHAIRSAAYFKEIAAGQMPVRWAHQFHYSYGTALFNFFAPLPYIAALPLEAVHLPLTLILKLGFATTYIAAGIFMYIFAEKLFRSKSAALLVTVMYQFAPFRLVEMNVRGNLGSLYAYAFLPLLFYAILRMKEKTDYKSFLLISLSVALLSLSHTIVGYSFIGLAVLFCVFFVNDWRKLLMLGAAFAAGIGLAAFFTIPALLEEKYTNGFLFSKDVFNDHFPALYKLLLPNFFDSPQLRIAEISVQIGLFHVLALLTLTVFLIKKHIHKNNLRAVAFILFSTIVTIIFMEPISKPLWERVELFRQFQYPWRFLAVIVFTTALASGYVFSALKHKPNKILFTGLIFLIVLGTAYYWKPTQGFDKPDEKAYWNYPLTTNYFSEVNTVWMGEEPKKYPPRRIETVGDNVVLYNVHTASTAHSFTVSSPKGALIVDHTFFFPGWKLMVDGVNSEIQFQDPNYRGQITFNVPAGSHQIVIRFEQSKIEQLGNLITVLTSLLFLLYPLFNVFVLKSKRHKGKLTTDAQP